MNEHFDIIIIGGGPAGLTAAVYARRAGKSVLLLEKESFGVRANPKTDSKSSNPRVTRLAKEDLEVIARGVEQLYRNLAEAYYLEADAEMSVRQQGDFLKISIPLRPRD